MTSSVHPPANDAANDASPPQVLELVHHHPGRLRLRAAALREDAELSGRVSADLEGVPGITRVTHNAQTGSVLVEYEPGLAQPDAISERIAEVAGLMSPFDPRAARPVFRPANAVIDGTRELNAIAEELTGGRVDLRSVVPAVLAGAAAYSFAFGRGPRLPRWDNLLWWSYSVFHSLHAREIQRAERTPLRAPVELP